jgi:hypothetical protein
MLLLLLVNSFNIYYYYSNFLFRVYIIYKRMTNMIQID